MKRSSSSYGSPAFTLIELLVVMAIIGILAAMLFGAISKAPPRARQIACVSNLRQLGIAFHSFAHDHQNRFPQSVPFSEGGASDFNRQSPGFSGVYLVNAHVFRVLSNELGSPHILVCPAGPQTKAVSFARLAYTNLSYFAHTEASYDQPQSLLSADNNLTLIQNTNSPIPLRAGSIPGYEWTKERHGERGNSLLADGSVEQRRNLPAQVRTYSVAPQNAPIVRSQPSAGNQAPRNAASEGSVQARAIPEQGLGQAPFQPQSSATGSRAPNSGTSPQVTPTPTNVLALVASNAVSESPQETRSHTHERLNAETSSFPWWLWLLLAGALAMAWEIRRRLNRRD